MANTVAKIYKVKVVPKDLKSIPGILPYNQFIQGDPKEVELTKMEINRCMSFGDVFMMDGDTVEDLPINTETFKELEFYEETTEGEDENGEEVESSNITPQSQSSVYTPRHNQPHGTNVTTPPASTNADKSHEDTIEDKNEDNEK